MPGYTWFGQNRLNIHVNAKCGSGGIGFLIENTFASNYNIQVLDKSHEGILWINFKHILTGSSFNLCVCYLPPEGSSRYVNVDEFFDNLLTKVYQYQNMGQYYICGDFNSRLGDLVDYIEGVDEVPPRDILDFSKNAHGQYFCNFLTDSNCCILNGRVDPTKNDYTSISVKGKAVVDYFAVPYTSLQYIKGFEIVSSTYMVNISCKDMGFESRHVPDHSLLKCSIQLVGHENQSKSSIPNVSSIKFDCGTIPPGFCDDESFLSSLNEKIQEISSSNLLYNDFCGVIRNEMLQKLPHRHIILKFGLDNKRRRHRKPWWNDSLADKWNKVCLAERKWLKTKDKHRNELKDIFIRMRKEFDRDVQRTKRRYWVQLQNEMVSSLDANPREFWKTIGRTGVADNRNQKIPFEVNTEEGSISTDPKIVLQKWRQDFEKMYNLKASCNNDHEINFQGPSNTCENQSNPDVSDFCRPITLEEVRRAVLQLKSNKASGVDEIPGEVLKNAKVITFLHKFFDACFETGKVPETWSKGIINPIPKASTSDSRDPLSYRGITLAPVTYKVYCTILNERLISWNEQHNIIVDEQNGFRKKRSTLDHLTTLTSIIETRKKARKSTYCAFIDFQKAFDTVNRDILWQKLQNVGIKDKLFASIRALYDKVMCTVRINGFSTDWFEVKCGLKQGCPLSPVLFSFFINDLALKMKGTDVGVVCGEEKVNILLFADDIVLLAENPNDLQVLLNILSTWCKLNGMVINGTKSNIVHFRTPSVPRTDTVFTIGDVNLDVVESYKYLGLILSEFLDFSKTAKAVAKSAHRALGLIIAKAKSFGGLPYNVFYKLYESIVCPVIMYGAPIWGTECFSCIQAVHNRAARYFLNVGKYTPVAAVNGDTAWYPMECRLWKSVLNHWCRLVNMDNNRLNKQVFIWCDLKSNNSCRNWNFRVRKQFQKYNVQENYQISYPINSSFICSLIVDKIYDDYVQKWHSDLNRTSARRGSGGNKLRTYKQMKNEFHVEPYCLEILSRKHRGALAKFRSGTAPIKVETGRYQNLDLSERVCFHCTSCIEDEEHVLMVCPVYDDLRLSLISEALLVNPAFEGYSDMQKMCFLLSDSRMVRSSAKVCSLILERRRNFLSRL